MSPASARAGLGRSGRRAPWRQTTPNREHFATFPKGDSARSHPTLAAGLAPLRAPGLRKTPNSRRGQEHRCRYPQPGRPHAGNLRRRCRGMSLPRRAQCGTWSPHQRVTYRVMPSTGGDAISRTGTRRMRTTRATYVAVADPNPTSPSWPFVLLPGQARSARGTRHHSVGSSERWGHISPPGPRGVT